MREAPLPPVPRAMAPAPRNPTGLRTHEQTAPPSWTSIQVRGIAIPRFYFDVREGAGFTPDDDGIEFANLDEAEREVAKAAADIGRDRLPKGDTWDVTVEVKNEHRQRVLTVTVTMEIHRVDPEPLPPHA